MKFQVCVLSLLLSGGVAISAENLISNGSFEEGKVGATQILPGWERRSAGNSFKYHGIDTKNASDGKRCGRIIIPAENPKDSGYFSSTKRFPLQSGKKYRLSMDVKLPQGKAQVNIIPIDSQNRPVSYSLYGKLKINNCNDWKNVELIYTVPKKGADSYMGKLQITLQGSGSFYFDNVKLEPLDAKSDDRAAAPAKNLLINGSFEDGKVGATKILPGWSRRTAGNSFNFHSVDSTQAADGKRSIKITIPDDAPPKSAGYITAQWVQAKNNKKYKLTFKARFPKGNAAAILTLYDSQKKYTGLKNVRKLAVKNSDNWQSYEMIYTPSSKDANCFISLRMALEEAGTVWFDDVKLIELTE